MSRPCVLIIGGSGFIGRRLAADLAAEKWRVIIVSRSPNRARQAAGGQFDYVSSLRHLYDSIRPELVINLAGASVGEGHWTPERKRELLESRLQPTQALADWLQRCPQPPKLVIQASAVGYYGNGSAAGWPPCDENAPPQDVFVSDLCRQWEALSQQMHETSGVPVAVCRFGVVLGQGGGILPQLLKPVSFCIGRIGSGRQALPWIHLDDLSLALRFLAAQNLAGWQAFNLTAPAATTQLDFARAAAKILRRPLLFAVPQGLMRLALGEQADLVLDGQFAEPQALRRLGFAFRFVDIQAALADLLRRPAR